MIEKIMKNVNEKNPLIHFLTNYVTVNDCANITLATGASPIMSDDINEVEDMVSMANALVLNIGTLNKRTIESMLKAAKKANELQIPVIFDPVGVGASNLRNEITKKILKEIKIDLLTGNLSEIKIIMGMEGNTKGVDATDTIDDSNLLDIIKNAKKLSKKLGCIVAISGEIDIVTNDKLAYIIRNGHSIMPKVTGTGCMLTSIMASYLAANKDKKIESVATAAILMGISGEKAYKKIRDENRGTSTFRNYLIDNISLLTFKELEEDMKIESI